MCCRDLTLRRQCGKASHQETTERSYCGLVNTTMIGSWPGGLPFCITSTPTGSCLRTCVANSPSGTTSTERFRRLGLSPPGSRFRSRVGGWSPPGSRLCPLGQCQPHHRTAWRWRCHGPEHRNLMIAYRHMTMIVLQHPHPHTKLWTHRSTPMSISMIDHLLYLI